jgi:hypothetical protein
MSSATVANQGFSLVSSMAGKMKELNVSQLTSDNVAQNTAWGNYKLVDVVGYSPTGFNVATQAAFPVQTLPNTTGNNLILTTGSIVLGAQVGNLYSGYTITSGGSATISLGGATAGAIITNGAIAKIVAGGLVNQPNASGGLVAFTGSEVLNLTVGAADLTAGALKVYLKVAVPL